MINKSKMGHYEVMDTKGHYGLDGRFETENEALAEINRSYKKALERGYDNRRNRWITVWCERTVERTVNDEFLHESFTRTAMSSIVYSEYEDKFVFAY